MPLLQLSESDLVDLGSATGCLMLTAAVLSPTGSLGVEQSSSCHARAVEAIARVEPELQSRVCFLQGDLLSAPPHFRSHSTCGLKKRKREQGQIADMCCGSEGLTEKGRV